MDYLLPVLPYYYLEISVFKRAVKRYFLQNVT